MLGFDVGEVSGDLAKVFVYGTLKAGGSNHYFLGDSCWLGKDAIADAILFDLGLFPMLVRGNGRVFGEVYEVSGETLAALDELEGHPDFYCRVLRVLESGMEAFVYEGSKQQVQGFPEILTGTWEESG